MSKPTTHNPSQFNPTDYEVVGYFDNKPPQFLCFTIGLSSEQLVELQRCHQARLENFQRELRDLFPKGNAYRCEHCGQGNVRYVVAATHIPTGERVCFGDICCDRMGIQGRDEFKARYIRTHAANLAAHEAKLEKINLYLSANLEFAEALKQLKSDDGTHANNFLAHDIASKFEQYGEISDKQRDAVVASIQRDIEFKKNREDRAAAELMARENSGVSEVKEGRYSITGKIATIKQYDNEFGISYKMLVVADDTTKYWCSVPAAFHVTESIGKRVTLTATWTRSEKDKFFAFGKRPSKASILEEVAA